MIKGLTDYEKLKVIRPIIGNCEYDDYKMPVIRKTDVGSIDWEKLRAIGVQNASPNNIDRNTLVLMFNYDKKLMALWNDPLKKIGLFLGYAAVATPDFSIYPNMNENEIRHNVFMARWLGVTWQNYNCTVLPTIGWATPETFDICFGGIEHGSVVVISTLGCKGKAKEFLTGFNEMKARLNPPLIIVFGEMIEGMTGTFLHYGYKDSFCKKNCCEQLRIDGIPRIFTIKEVA
ncbi:MAG: DUF4417 domain-containing protein [Clostridiales bacterium]|nr:DUF4417 domain-containing protein [Clostridiales bacterium]